MDELSDSKTISPEVLIASDLIKATIDKLGLSQSAEILKIGVGSGEIEKRISKRVPKGHLKVIGTHQHSLDLCQLFCDDCPNIEIIKQHAKDIDNQNEYDFICSFMCIIFLTKPIAVYRRIFEALKPGGQMLLIIPSESGPVHGTLTQVKENSSIPEIKALKDPIDFRLHGEIQDEIQRIPFSSLHVSTPVVNCEIHNLKTFSTFLNQFRYMYTPILSEDLIDKLFDEQTKYFDQVCQEKHDGRYIFQYTPYIVHAVK